MKIFLTHSYRVIKETVSEMKARILDASKAQYAISLSQERVENSQMQNENYLIHHLVFVFQAESKTEHFSSFISKGRQRNDKTVKRS